MTATTEDSLVEQIRRSGARAKQTAAEAMVGLAGAAEQLEMRETSQRLRDTRERLRSDTFNLMVMGRFKNGKSTILNALMGGTTREIDLGGHKGPMVVDDLPATATLTAVHYADEPEVTAWAFDGSCERWSLERYLKESILDVDEKQSQLRFGHIRQFEMGFPARLCQAGVTVFDSPGLDEHPTRTAITREATRICDAAVIMYRSDVLMGHTEVVDATTMVAEGTRIFTVINLWDGRRVDDRLRAFVWNKYVRDHLDGPSWDHQDLASRDIYFVDARAARDGRYGGDLDALASSGLPDLERRLGEFLVRDRQHVHLEKFTTQATALGAAIDTHISQRRAALQADQEQLREAYADVLPRLTAVRARHTKLSKVFDRYREEAQAALVASFVAAVVRMRQELPEHLAASQLPSGESFLPVLKQKKLVAEASEAVSAFVSERIDQWAQNDAAGLLDDIVARLGDEIAAEIAAIARQFDDIHFDLTGWSMGATASGSVVGTTERVLSAVAGLLLGDASAALTGGASGWRGAAGGIGGVFGSAFLLGLFGVTSATVLWPVTLAAALVMGAIGGGIGFETRVKKKVVEQTDPMLATLAEEVGPKISEKVAESLGRLEKQITDEVVAIIDEEERNIAQIVELNQRNQADRERELDRLGTISAAVVEHRHALDTALAVAKQV